jgi:UDP-N-acetyl-2-amino-2-deoxyglucuronate dehydrogenase
MTWRFGIVGAGMIGHWHAEAIRALPNAELVGVCDHGSGKGERIGPRCGCARGVCELERFIARDDLDAITVATPSGAHGEAALLAARHGKHCVVEKPLEISLARIDAMIEAHAKAGTALGGIFNGRFAPPARLFHEAVQAGRFGRLTCGLAIGPWWRDQAYYDEGGWKGTLALDGGGALMNQGIHSIDLLQWLMGPVAEVCARTATLAHERIEVEDTGAATLQFANGALGSIVCTTSMWPGSIRTVEVGGTDGTVAMGDDTFFHWRFRSESPADDELRKRYLRFPAVAVGAANPSAGFSVDGHRDNLAEFLAALEAGRAPLVDGAEARKSVRIILAIYESARRGGAPVRLD